MAQDIPKPEQLKDRVASGIPISKAELSDITKAEQDATSHLEKGGPAATASSLYRKQQHFENKLAEVTQKPPDHKVTKEEAKAVQSAEVRIFPRTTLPPPNPLIRAKLPPPANPKIHTSTNTPPHPSPAPWPAPVQPQALFRRSCNPSPNTMHRSRTSA